MMNKQIHFWSFMPDEVDFMKVCDELVFIDECYEMCLDHATTEKAITKDYKIIHTISMIDLSFELQSKYGYDIYIHDENCPEGYLISYDERQCNRTERELREAHNIAKMWLAGEFSHEVN